MATSERMADKKRQIILLADMDQVAGVGVSACVCVCACFEGRCDTFGSSDSEIRSTMVTEVAASCTTCKTGQLRLHKLNTFHIKVTPKKGSNRAIRPCYDIYAKRVHELTDTLKI